MSENNNSFSVLDMANSYAATNDIDPSEIFKKSSEDENIKAESKNENDETLKVNEVSKKEKKPWMPDPELIEGMNEFSGPVTYAKDEIKVDEIDKTLKNISDDNAIRDSIESMNELQRKQANIEVAKKRHGISKFQIPEGPYHASIFAAACDTNYKNAQEKLDVIFEEIKSVHPEFILEYLDTNTNIDTNKNENNIEDIDLSFIDENNDNIPPVEINIDKVSEDDVKVIIDKSKLNEVSWSPEEISKIKKSRTVELNIVETSPIEYSEIQDVDSNMVDIILAPYQRKYNDVSVALPASRYRATFTGLSYAELTDLATSSEMNSIDAERKKWSICYNHIKNQNIGPWEEYKWYIDPNTKKKVRIGISDNAPNNINPYDIHTVSKFDDFLMKTSYIDLEFMIWKILCATAMENEIIAITCHAKHNGKECNKTYDWVYNPSELLRMDLIDPVILEEMKVTGEASTKEEILNNYNSSPLNVNSTVKLNSSGISVVFGHISAYVYLNEVFGLAETLNSMIEAEDPSSISKGYNILLIKAIKSFLIPQDDGKYVRISGSNNILKVIESLNEVDWQTIFEISKMMTDPYDFKYSFQNLVCPSCHNRSSIDIENMTQLLFIVAQSLSSVQVVLKRT